MIPPSLGVCAQETHEGFGGENPRGCCRNKHPAPGQEEGSDGCDNGKELFPWRGWVGIPREQGMVQNPEGSEHSQKIPSVPSPGTKTLAGNGSGAAPAVPDQLALSNCSSSGPPCRGKAGFVLLPPLAAPKIDSGRKLLLRQLRVSAPELRRSPSRE